MSAAGISQCPPVDLRGVEIKYHLSDTVADCGLYQIQSILRRTSQYIPELQSTVVVVLVLSVCVCVCFLPIHSGHQVRWTYQPGSHRRKVTQDF